MLQTRKRCNSTNNREETEEHNSKNLVDNEVENVNSNHAIENRKKNKLDLSKSKVKSKVVKVKTIQEAKNSTVFEANGDEVSMEIEGQNFSDDNDNPNQSEPSDTESEGEISEEEEEQKQEEQEQMNNESEAESEDEETVCKKLHKRAKKQERWQRRESMESKLDMVSTTLQQMKKFMAERGFDFNEEEMNRQKAKPAQKQGKSIVKESDKESEVTIYKDAVKKVSNDSNEFYQQMDDPEISFKTKPNRESSSSEDRIDTSDEMMEIDINEQFIADCEKEPRWQRNAQQINQDKQPDHADMEDPLERSQQVIREAEASKARLFATKGTYSNVNNPNWGSLNEMRNVKGTKASDVDDKYLVIRSHVDVSIQQKIINNEYVDFAKLLPRNRFGNRDEETRLELVTHEGATYFVPANDKDNLAIMSFGHWEQAFRVFCNIFTRVYPNKASELIQYNHIIHLASCIYIWENVYTYDKEFRMHISNFPQRSWAIILQQAWSMYLKDRIPLRFDNQFRGGSSSKSKEICKRFNKGNVPMETPASTTTAVMYPHVVNLATEGISAGREYKTTKMGIEIATTQLQPQTQLHQFRKLASNK